MTFNFRKEKYDEKGVIYGGSDCCNDDDTIPAFANTPPMEEILTIDPSPRFSI